MQSSKFHNNDAAHPKNNWLARNNKQRFWHWENILIQMWAMVYAWEGKQDCIAEHWVYCICVPSTNQDYQPAKEIYTNKQSSVFPVLTL